MHWSHRTRGWSKLPSRTISYLARITMRNVLMLSWTLVHLNRILLDSMLEKTPRLVRGESVYLEVREPGWRSQERSIPLQELFCWMIRAHCFRSLPVTSWLIHPARLSAVDAHTAKHIVEHCFAGPLMAGRTIVLVTHHVKLCYGRASLIIRLEDGQVAVTDTVRLEAVTTASEPALDVDSENETLVVSESTKAARTTMPATPANGSLITKENRAEVRQSCLPDKCH